MTSEAWWARKLCEGKRESQEGLWELMLGRVQSKEGGCGREGCVARGPSHTPWVDLTPAGRAVFLVVFMLHSGAAGWVPAFHRGSWCSFTTGRSPRKTFPFEDPKDFDLGMGRVGGALGLWRGSTSRVLHEMSPQETSWDVPSRDFMGHRCPQGARAPPWDECWWPCVRKLWVPQKHSSHLDHAVHDAGALGEDGWPWGRGWGEERLKSTHTPLVQPRTVSGFR